MRSTIVVVVLLAALAGTHAQAASVVFQDTTTSVGGYVFGGASATDLATNIDINQLDLTPGTAGYITTISVLGANFGTVAFSVRPEIYIWAANGAGGLPGTLLAEYTLSLTNFASDAEKLISVTIPFGSVPVPANDEIWAGLGYESGAFGSPTTINQLNEMGAVAYNPPTVGTDGITAYQIAPGGATSNPAVTPYDTTGTGDYGWTVTATITPEPSAAILLSLGLGAIMMLRKRNVA